MLSMSRQQSIKSHRHISRLAFILAFITPRTLIMTSSCHMSTDLYDDELARRTMREALRKVNRAVKRTEIKWLKRVSFV